VLSFLDVTKYPPSLLFLLMTLGPALAALAWFERLEGPVSRGLVTFGRVPLFFYVVHLYVVHALSVLAGALQGLPLADFLDVWMNYPRGRFGFGLPVVYVVWAVVVAGLFPACRWFAEVKRTSKAAWLSYL